MLANLYRFHGHGSLRYVFKNGDSVRSRVCTLKYSRNKHRQESRFSVSISKKIFKSAVKRNRVRRRVYEIIRGLLPEIHDAHDAVIIITSPDILVMPHTELREALAKLLQEAHLLGSPTF